MLEYEGSFGQLQMTPNTVCPKVRYISNVPLFSAICGWILKSFALMIATTGRFDMVYEVA